MATRNMDGGFELENDANSPGYDLNSYETPAVSNILGNQVSNLFGENLKPDGNLENFTHLLGELSVPIPVSKAPKGASLFKKFLKHEGIAAGGAGGITAAENQGVESTLGKMAAGAGGAAAASALGAIRPKTIIKSTKDKISKHAGAPERWINEQSDKRARDILQKATEDIPNKKKAADLLQFQKKRDALYSDVGATEAGQDTRNSLSLLHKKLDDERRKATQPLYEKLKNSKTKTPVPAIEQWFSENNKILKGDILREVTRLERDLFNNWKPSQPAKKLLPPLESHEQGQLKDVIELLKSIPHKREEIEKQLSPSLKEHLAKAIPLKPEETIAPTQRQQVSSNRPEFHDTPWVPRPRVSTDKWLDKGRDLKGAAWWKDPHPKYYSQPEYRHLLLNQAIDEKLKTTHLPNREHIDRQLRAARTEEPRNFPSFVGEEILESSPPPEEIRTVLPIEIENTLQAARDKVFSSNSMSKSDKTVLLDLIQAGERDLKAIPEGIAHTRIYDEKSKPINRLTSQTRFGRILQKEPSTGFFRMEDDQVPAKILTSKERTRDLIKYFKDEPEKLESLKDHIRFSLADQVIGHDGQISLQKLKTWKAKYKGAFELDRTLHPELKDIESAQKLIKKISILTSEKPVFEGISNLPFSTVSKFLPSIGVKAGLFAKIAKKLSDPLIKDGRDRLLAESQVNPELAELLLTPLKDKKSLNAKINKIPTSNLQNLLSAIEKTPPQVALNVIGGLGEDGRDKNNAVRFSHGGSAAQIVQSKGRGGDTMLAHITPAEAFVLKQMGGRGTINPATGLREFRGDGPDSVGSGGGDGSSYQGDSHSGRADYSREDREALDRHIREVADRPDRPDYSREAREALDAHIREVAERPDYSQLGSIASILGPAMGMALGGMGGFSLGGMLGGSFGDRGGLSGIAADAVFPGAGLIGNLYGGLENIRRSLGGGVPFQKDNVSWERERANGGSPYFSPYHQRQKKKWTERIHKPIRQTVRPRPADWPKGEYWQYFDDVNPPWEFDTIEREDERED